MKRPRFLSRTAPQSPKHARAVTAPEPGPAPTAGTGEGSPAVRPLSPSPFTGASDIGVMDAPARVEPAGPEDLAARRARLQEVATDLLDDMTLIDVPAAVLRPKGTVATASDETADEESPDQETPSAARLYAPPNLDGGTPGDLVPVHADCTPDAYLRVMTGHGGSWEPLYGLPFFAGQRTDPDGSKATGICFGEYRSAQRVLDFTSVAVLDALQTAIDQAREALTFGWASPAPVEDAPAEATPVAATGGGR
jgi:hypothetical protein